MSNSYLFIIVIQEKRGKQQTQQQQQSPSKLLIGYIKNMQVMNKKTAEEYHNRLSIFEKFVLHNIVISHLILWLMISITEKEKKLIHMKF